MEDNQPSNTTARRLSNGAQSINRLPPELLSRAFVLGEGRQRGSRALSRPYVGFQDLVTQVCHHWREVAIYTPVLWSYIFISRPPPHRHAELYLARSGPSCLLDIDIEMKTPYIDGIFRFAGDLQADRALQTLQFIVAHGGQLTRWKSLIVLAKTTEVIFKTISFINSGRTPALQFLSLTSKSNLDVVEDQALGALDAASGIIEETGVLGFGPQRPQLRSVELNEIAKGFVFDRATPLFSNLTHLKYRGSFLLPSIQATSVLLSASPRLESLHIDVTHSDIFQLAPAPLQVRLPLLRSFFLNTSALHNWSLSLLQTVDAPAVEHFELSAGVRYRTNQGNLGPLVQFLGVGRINGALQCNQVLANQPNCGPIFPSLRHLGLKLLSVDHTVIRELLRSYPMIAQVTLNYPSLLVLADSPELLPNVAHFSYCDIRDSRFRFQGVMQKVAQSRARLGMRIPTLEIVFTGRSTMERDGDDEDMGLDYITLLGGLVDELDVRDNESDVPDSDDDFRYPEMMNESDVEILDDGESESDSDSDSESESEVDMDVVLIGSL